MRLLRSIAIAAVAVLAVASAGCPPQHVIVVGKAAPTPAGARGKATPKPTPAPRFGVATMEKIAWPGAAAGADLLGVAALSTAHAIAVGAPGAVWIDDHTLRLAPFSDGIATSVWADGPGYAVAVGYGGISHVWNGKTWSDAATGTDADLHAVWGRSLGKNSRQVFAGGGKGTILTLGSAGTWTKMSAPDGVTVYGFAGAGEKTWAVGQTAGEPGDGVILRLEGDHWVDVCRELACDSAIYAAWASSPTDLWTGGANGELVHYVAGQPELLKSGTRGAITSIWGTSPADVFVAGDGGFAIHWDGKAWAPLASGDEDLRAIGGLAADGEVWMVGNAGTIRHVTRAAVSGGGS